MGHKSGESLLGDGTAKALQRAALNLVQELAQAQTEASLKALVAIRDNPEYPPNVRRMAANDLLAWGWHKDTDQWGGAAGGGGSGSEKPGIVVQLLMIDASGNAKSLPLDVTAQAVDVVEQARRALKAGLEDGGA